MACFNTLIVSVGLDHFCYRMTTIDNKTGDKYHIDLTFVLSTSKILIQIDNNYQLDLRNSKFGELIGFREKIVNKTEYGTILPSITNSIDMICTRSSH